MERVASVLQREGCSSCQVEVPPPRARDQAASETIRVSGSCVKPQVPPPTLGLTCGNALRSIAVACARVLTDSHVDPCGERTGPAPAERKRAADQTRPDGGSPDPSLQAKCARLRRPADEVPNPRRGDELGDGVGELAPETSDVARRVRRGTCLEFLTRAGALDGPFSHAWARGARGSRGARLWFLIRVAARVSAVVFLAVDGSCDRGRLVRSVGSLGRGPRGHKRARTMAADSCLTEVLDAIAGARENRRNRFIGNTV